MKYSRPSSGQNPQFFFLTLKERLQSKRKSKFYHGRPVEESEPLRLFWLSSDSLYARAKLNQIERMKTLRIHKNHSWQKVLYMECRLIFLIYGYEKRTEMSNDTWAGRAVSVRARDPSAAFSELLQNSNKNKKVNQIR